MKRFACGDVIPGCGATYTAEDEDGIFAQCMPHGAAEHGLTEENTPDLRATVRGFITAA